MTQELHDDLYAHSNRFECVECGHSTWVRWYGLKTGVEPTIPVPEPECHGKKMFMAD